MEERFFTLLNEEHTLVCFKAYSLATVGGAGCGDGGKNFAGCVGTACVFLRRTGSHRGLRRIERIGGRGKMQLPGEFSSHRGRTYDKVIDFYQKAVTM